MQHRPKQDNQLDAYKNLLDEEIARYVAGASAHVLETYGAFSHTALGAYLSVLSRGGKRLRGALMLASYEAYGGTDQVLALQVARIIEMVHAYILVIDDINDRSDLRRGGPAAHILQKQYHEKSNLLGTAAHFGESTAMNAALIGNHLAMTELATLRVGAERRLAVLKIINETMVVTGHGQLNDIYNETDAEASAAAVDRVLEWKTAHYTFLNPLRVGMALLGKEVPQSLYSYAMHVGRAFQITDDLIGIFGDVAKSGKSPMDDIKEGKRTLLTVYALKKCSKNDKQFLLAQLGNRQLTKRDFDVCKEILISCGAKSYAETQAKKHVHSAKRSLLESADLPVSFTELLSGLADYLLTRAA
jgi:geranylgeranyl diphosphate synthase type II